MNTNNLTFLEFTLKMPLMELPVRSTVVTTGTGKILISPGSKLQPKDYEEISGITDIVAPNHLHAAGIKKAAALYPNARVWYAPGLKEKRPRLPWTDELNEKNWPYQAELPMILLRGMPKINEVLFVHPASNSLIVTDMTFNMHDRKGIGALIIETLFGTRNRFAMSRFFALFIKDKKAFRESLKRVFEADFDQIVVSHGRNVENAGKEALRSTLRDRGYAI